MTLIDVIEEYIDILPVRLFEPEASNRAHGSGKFPAKWTMANFWLP